MIKLTQKEIWSLLRELDSICYICKKRIFLMCGTPEVRVGGCCSGYYLDSTNWMTPRYAHYSCFSKRKYNGKTLLEEKETIKLLKEIMVKKLDNEKCILSEPLCKNKWRLEVKEDIKKIKNKIEYLDNLEKNWS